jgi:hypothetical protein
MRYILLFLFILLIALIIAFSDFVLLRLVRERMAEINDRARKAHHYRPISIPSVLMASLAFWVPPFYLLGDQHLLEFKIFATLLYWLLASVGLNFYIRMRSSQQTASASLPFLVSFAIASGLLLGPALSAIGSFMANR